MSLNNGIENHLFAEPCKQIASSQKIQDQI